MSSSSKRRCSRMVSCFITLHCTIAMQCSLATCESSGFSIRLRNTARMMRVTFSLAQSLRISARMGITLNLFIFSANSGLKVSTHRQNTS
uniref:Putative secreted protein n=1 Tax=Anopheles triannulatus TaxID=58253 RepID=A0A2M4B1A8_9DIPT